MAERHTVPKGLSRRAKARGGWVVLDRGSGKPVGVRVGISYVSEANAEANLRAENPTGITFDVTRNHAQDAWNRELNKIAIEGGTRDEQVVFYTALYHSLMARTSTAT